ncbi:MAG: sensor histidine kinase [Nocardioidaceae bacterium]
MTLPRLWPATLTGRLVATLVAVLVVATTLVAVVTTVEMRGYLTDRLDQQLAESLGRSVNATLHGVPPTAGGTTDGRGDDDEPPTRYARGQRPGTLTVVFDDTAAIGGVVAASGHPRAVGGGVIDAVRRIPADGRVHETELPGLGHYRLEAADLHGAVVVAGLPVREVDGTVAKLVLWEALLGLAAVAVAALVGQALVRGQLRPLRRVAGTAHQVAALPLDSGEIGRTVRVPESLTDPRTEVGQVGAALNTLLAHVEEALDARHRSEQQVRRFVADASHELRTPLSTIQGYAELSRRSGDAADLTRTMGKVESEAQRMARLVEDLLLLARLDAGRPLERREVDLTKLVLEAVDDARVVGPEHRWLLRLPDEPLLVTGDEQRLHQVVTNLLNNARRHTPAGTTVTVSARAEPDAVVLDVHDDGPGLPPGVAGSAFERFTRGDSSRTRASGGAGLGLSLVDAITAAHGGTVSVASRPGDTTFTVRLPL